MTACEVLDGIRGRLGKANPLGAEWAALTDPGDRNRAPAWIVDADDLEVRLDATYAAGKVATFIAAAPVDVARLVAAVEAVLRLADRARFVARAVGKNDGCVSVGQLHAAIEAALKEGE